MPCADIHCFWLEFCLSWIKLRLYDFCTKFQKSYKLDSLLCCWNVMPQKSKICFVCNRETTECWAGRSPVKDHWIECDTCRKWFHGRCCGLSKTECQKIIPFEEDLDPIGKGLKLSLKGNTTSPATLRQTPGRVTRGNSKTASKTKTTPLSPFFKCIICCLKHVIKENQQIPDKILSIVDSAGQNEDQLKSPIIQRLPTSISQVDTQEGLSAQECPSQLDQDLATPPGIAAAPAL